MDAQLIVRRANSRSGKSVIAADLLSSASTSPSRKHSPATRRAPGAAGFSADEMAKEALNAALLTSLPEEETVVLSYRGALHERRGRLGSEAEAHYRRALHLRSHHGLGELAEARKRVDQVARRQCAD